MVFYKILFKQREKITGSMALMYSTLVGNSLLHYGEVFDADGNFDYDCARQTIYDLTEGGKYYIDYYPMKVCTLAKKLGMTQYNVRLTLERLDQANFIGIEQDSIYCPLNLLDEGFMKVPNDTKLKGWQLIDYAFMKDRAWEYYGEIDTWASRLAEMLHTSRENVYMTIKRLKDKGYVERLASGHLHIK